MRLCLCEVVNLFSPYLLLRILQETGFFDVSFFTATLDNADIPIDISPYLQKLWISHRIKRGKMKCILRTLKEMNVC